MKAVLSSWNTILIGAVLLVPPGAHPRSTTSHKSKLGIPTRRRAMFPLVNSDSGVDVLILPCLLETADMGKHVVGPLTD